MDVLSHIARELGLTNYRTSREVSVHPNVRVDAVIEAGEKTLLIELKSRGPTPEDIAWMLLARDLWMEDPAKSCPAVLVLAVPGASNKARRLADEVGVEIVEVPANLLPVDADRIGTAPLTTEKSWAVVTTLLREQRFSSVRDLAERAAVSTGWTYKVVGELEARGSLLRRAGSLMLDDPVPILDAVSSERPLGELETRKVPTGLDDPEEIGLTLMLGAQDMSEDQGRPGLYACGVTAAAHYTNYLVQRGRVDIYSETPNALAELFTDRSGGITLHIYDPDRPIRGDSRFIGDMLCVSKEQALLDVAGTGMAFRDLTLKLLEVLAP